MTTSDQQLPVPQSVLAEEKRIAHAGAPRPLAGACARHPRRVVFGWTRVFVVLIGLNAAFHGKLINDFKIPGLGHAEGDRPDQREVRRPEGRRPARRAGGPGGERSTPPIAPRRSRRCSSRARVAADAGRRLGGRRRRSRARSRRVGAARRQRPDRVLRRAVRPHRLRAAALGHRRDRGPAPRDREPAGIQVEFTGEAESAPPDAGHQRPHRPARGVRDPDGAVPRAGADGDPASVRDRRRARRVPACCSWRRA